MITDPSDYEGSSSEFKKLKTEIYEALNADPFTVDNVTEVASKMPRLIMLLRTEGDGKIIEQINDELGKAGKRL